MKATSDEPTELWRKQAVCLCAQAARANDLSQGGEMRTHKIRAWKSQGPQEFGAAAACGDVSVVTLSDRPRPRPGQAAKPSWSHGLACQTGATAQEVGTGSTVAATSVELFLNGAGCRSQRSSWRLEAVDKAFAIPLSQLEPDWEALVG